MDFVSATFVLCQPWGCRTGGSDTKPLPSVRHLHNGREIKWISVNQFGERVGNLI